MLARVQSPGTSRVNAGGFVRAGVRAITIILAAIALQMCGTARAHSEMGDTRDSDGGAISATPTNTVQPDTAARAKELARRLGLPPEAVERDLAAVDAMTHGTAGRVSDEADWINQEFQRQRQQGAGQAVASMRLDQPDMTKQFWGAIFGVWIAVAGLPYLIFTFAVATKRMGIDDPRIWKLGAFWSPGFMALFPIHDYLHAPGSGIVWSMLYGTCVAVIWKMGSRLRYWPQSPTTRVCLVALVAWVALLQAWGFIFDWTEHFEPGQFAALHVLPPTFLVAAWLARRWIASSQQ